MTDTLDANDGGTSSLLSATGISSHLLIPLVFLTLVFIDTQVLHSTLYFPNRDRLFFPFKNTLGTGPYIALFYV